MTADGRKVWERFFETVTAADALCTAIRVSRRREIAVEIANNDNKAGAISLAMLLTDGTFPKKSTIYMS